MQASRANRTRSEDHRGQSNPTMDTSTIIQRTLSDRRLKFGGYSSRSVEMA